MLYHKQDDLNVTDLLITLADRRTAKRMKPIPRKQYTPGLYRCLLLLFLFLSGTLNGPEIPPYNPTQNNGDIHHTDKGTYPKIVYLTTEKFSYILRKIRIRTLQ